MRGHVEQLCEKLVVSEAHSRSLQARLASQREKSLEALRTLEDEHRVKVCMLEGMNMN